MYLLDGLQMSAHAAGEMEEERERGGGGGQRKESYTAYFRR